MISWEILRSSGNPPRKPNKSTRRVKKSSFSAEERNEDEEEELEEKHLDLEGSESDESEYFSASEHFPEERAKVDECLGEDVDGSDSNAGDSDDEEVCTTLQAVSVSVSDRGGERKRRLSKKQKKKRRRQGKENFLCYAEYTAPFQFAESMDYSIDDLREDVVGGTYNAPARVPSLFELCTKSLWSKKNSLLALRYQLLPIPLKTAVSLQRQSQAFANFQLSCLYRSLAELESKKSTSYLTMVATRNVWSKGVIAMTRDSPGWMNANTLAAHGEEGFGNEITAMIPFTYACYGFHEVHGYTDPRSLVYAISRK